MKKFYQREPLKNKLESIDVTRLLIKSLIFFIIFPPIFFFLIRFILAVTSIVSDPYSLDLMFKSGYMLGIVILITIILVRYPLAIMIYAVKRISAYISISTTCTRSGHKMKLSRPIFASVFGIKSKADIQIATSEGLLFIHFVDFPIPARKSFTLINEKEYDIAKTLPKKPQISFGRFFVHSTESEIYKDNIMQFPEFDHTLGRHIIVVHPVPSHCLFVDTESGENNLKPLYSGYTVGNLSYYSTHGLLRLLKRL